MQTSAWGLVAAVIVASAALYPMVQHRWAAHQIAARLAFIERSAGNACAAIADQADSTLSLRVQRLGPLLSSWETVGGCGAGGSGSGGVSLKWIGRNVHGGLFNVTQTAGYMHLFTDPKSQEFAAGGYNLTSSTTISKDLSEKWNFGVVIPLIYKAYNDYRPSTFLPRRDVTNGGLGDMSVVLIRKWGEINDTISTLTVGLPTGAFSATVPGEGSMLTQEKQLGFGKPTLSLTLDHVFDEIWGLIVVGGAPSYRGALNKNDSYRAPSGSAYSYVGYYAGPFVPAFGLTATGFTAHDRDVNAVQNTPLFTLAPSASLEWTSDYVALILGGSLPFGTSFNGKYAMLPWTVALGISISPF